MMATSTGYPADLSIDYPDRDLGRLSTLLRIFFVIPVAIVLVLLSGNSGAGARDANGSDFSLPYAAPGLLVLPTLLLLLFRAKYPKWWFDWNVALTNFSYRVTVYVTLLRDEYPSTDEEQAVHLNIPYPNVAELNRWLPLVKWLLAVPHYIVLAFLLIAAVFAVIIAWFAILFTGRYPKALFDFVVGVHRWTLRVSAYAFLLVTDRYPPFSLT